MMLPEEYNEEISHHKELFSGSSLELGKIHWYIQKADTEMTRRCFVRREGEPVALRLIVRLLVMKLGRMKLTGGFSKEKQKLRS